MKNNSSNHKQYDSKYEKIPQIDKNDVISESISKV